VLRPGSARGRQLARMMSEAVRPCRCDEHGPLEAVSQQVGGEVDLLHANQNVREQPPSKVRISGSLKGQLVRGPTPIEVEDVLGQHLKRHALELEQIDVPCNRLGTAVVRHRGLSLMSAATARFNHTRSDTEPIGQRIVNPQWTRVPRNSPAYSPRA